MTVHIIRGNVYVVTNPNKRLGMLHTYHTVTIFRYFIFGIRTEKIGVMYMNKWLLDGLSLRGIIKKRFVK